MDDSVSNDLNVICGNEFICLSNVEHRGLLLFRSCNLLVGH